MAQHTWPPDEPHEVVLAAGEARLAVDLRGGGLRRLVVGDWDVIDGYPAGRRPGRLAGRRPRAVAQPGARRPLDVARPGAAARRAARPTSRTPSTASSPGSPGPSSTGRRPRPRVGTVLEPHPGYPFRLAVALDYAPRPDRLR